VFLGDLGEIPNWGVLVDDSRHWLLCWVHNYLAEQAGSAIYRLPQRWPVNLRETWWPEKKVTSAVVRGLLPWQALRRPPDGLT
jgi:hypothetical protein